MTEEERISLVSVRLQNAKETLKEVPVHIENGFWNIAIPHKSAVGDTFFL